MSDTYSPDVENLVTELTPMAEKIATDKRDFIINDLDVSILLKPGLEIIWPMVVDNVPTMLRVSIDLMLDLLSKMQPNQVQYLLQNHRVYKAIHDGEISKPRNISTEDSEFIFHDANPTMPDVKAEHYIQSKKICPNCSNAMLQCASHYYCFYCGNVDHDDTIYEKARCPECDQDGYVNIQDTVNFADYKCLLCGHEDRLMKQ